MQLRSYRTLNAAKWTVINGIEGDLPIQPFTDEWAILKAAPLERAVLRSAKLGKLIQPLARYAELSVVEQLVPVIFAGLFLVVLGRGVA